MPLLVDLYLRFKDDSSIYVDGTVESVLAVRETLQLCFRVLTSGTGVLYPSQAQVRLSGTIEVWQRSTAVEDRNDELPPHRHHGCP